jgi:polyisoprenoid-binding protein YceI
MSTKALQAVETPAVETTRWRIDPARSSIEFHTPTFWGLMTVHGSFGRYEGTLDLRRDPAVELTIEAGSVDTKNKVRDKHLRSADFFDVDNHPQVRFVSDSAKLEGERLTVRGQLHAAGASVPLEIDARLGQVGQDLEVEALVHTDHRKLGMSHGLLGMIPPTSELTVRGRLVPDAG